MTPKARLLIGAATSGSGKTTFTMGLLRALRNRGLRVQPFKCGPDYIDPMFHTIASGQPSINLDTWLASEEHTRSLFCKHSADADISVVEGVMGLFDGYERSKGSSAEIAMQLDIPVILVVNSRSVAYSVAPLIHGFKTFRPELRLAGVVFNMVASENHYRFLREACQDASVECLGYMQRNPDINVPGRHLGLTITAKEETERLVTLAAEEIERHVDIDRMIELCSQSSDVESIQDDNRIVSEQERQTNSSSNALPIVAVAKDEAFNFIYQANIDALQRTNRVVFFSPLRDSSIPDCDALYLPGGYPELFADELSANVGMRQSIREYAEQGGHIFAECGGFMYLTQSIDGKPMCGIFPFEATMQGARLHLGYRRISDQAVIDTLRTQCPFIPFRTDALLGHEFHYSTIKSTTSLPDSITVLTPQLSAKGTAVDTAIYHYLNVTAGYTHWYWG